MIFLGTGWRVLESWLLSNHGEKDKEICIIKNNGQTGNFTIQNGRLNFEVKMGGL
jgi:hypothetical protein